MNNKREVYFSVDVETSGPIPGKYSLLTIGACLAYNPTQTFSCQLKPISMNADPKAMEITGLSLENLHKVGLEPQEAMKQFKQWVDVQINSDEEPIFVGFNAAFDWSFINFYFHQFLGNNPFGFAALDIKSMYMGAINGTWSQTRSSKITDALHPKTKGDHNALHDAQYQAELFRLIRSHKK